MNNNVEEFECVDCIHYGTNYDCREFCEGRDMFEPKCKNKDIRITEEMYDAKSFTSYMKKKYDNREDKDNIFGVGISDAEFRKFAIDYLLGKDWYVVDPLGRDQINEIALHQILQKYSKEYRKELKEENSK